MRDPGFNRRAARNAEFSGSQTCPLRRDRRNHRPRPAADQPTAGHCRRTRHRAGGAVRAASVRPVGGPSRSALYRTPHRPKGERSPPWGRSRRHAESASCRDSSALIGSPFLCSSMASPLARAVSADSVLESRTRSIRTLTKWPTSYGRTTTTRRGPTAGQVTFPVTFGRNRPENEVSPETVTGCRADTYASEGDGTRTRNHWIDSPVL